MRITLQDLADRMAADNRRQQIFDAIKPQLDQLEQLFDQYVPRKIGKHHPEYVAPEPGADQ